jgi:hypothetical protein
MKIRTVNEMEIGHQKFRLYISNRTARSLLALAKKEQILSIPALERISPKSEKRIIGDLSDTRRVLGALGLRLEM